MPLFEYECRTCGHHFEYLTRAGRSAACPSCESHDLRKLLSAFAVGTTGGDRARHGAAGSCGMCGDPRGPGSCSIN